MVPILEYTWGMARTSPQLAIYLPSPAWGKGSSMYLGNMTMENEFVWDDSDHDEHGFYIGSQEGSTTSTPAERRDDGEVENDHYFEMRNELRGWE